VLAFSLGDAIAPRAGPMMGKRLCACALCSSEKGRKRDWWFRQDKRPPKRKEPIAHSSSQSISSLTALSKFRYATNRRPEAPGDNRKAYGFGLLDWRDSWFDGRVAKGTDR